MLSHPSLGTNDADRAAAFYDPVFAVLDIRKTGPRDRFRPATPTRFVAPAEGDFPTPPDMP